MLRQHLARNSRNEALQLQKTANTVLAKMPKNDRFSIFRRRLRDYASIVPSQS
jgi:hypothetical protein